MKLKPGKWFNLEKIKHNGENKRRSGKSTAASKVKSCHTQSPFQAQRETVELDSKYFHQEQHRHKEMIPEGDRVKTKSRQIVWCPFALTKSDLDFKIMRIIKGIFFNFIYANVK